VKREVYIEKAKKKVTEMACGKTVSRKVYTITYTDAGKRKTGKMRFVK